MECHSENIQVKRKTKEARMKQRRSNGINKLHEAGEDDSLDTWDQLQRQAAKEKTSANAIIHRLVSEYLQQVKQKVSTGVTLH